MRRAFTDRLTISEAVEAVGKMVRGYANRGSADKGYIGAIAELLCQYPRSLALACAHPFNGVVTTTSFLPTPHDIVVWLEPHLNGMTRRLGWEEGAERQLQQRKGQASLPPPKHTRYNLLVKSDRPRYEEMCKRASAADADEYLYADGGIWIPQTWWFEGAAKVGQFRTMTDAELRAHYGSAEAKRGAGQ